MVTGRFVAISLAVAIMAAACSDDPTGWPSGPAGTDQLSPAPVSETIATLVPRCVDGDIDLQRHGSTCLCCHTDDFGVAGSVDPGGSPIARVIVTDADGDVASMAPDRFFNFFRHFTMKPPFRAVVYGADGRALAMRSASPSADCNVCHYAGGPSPLIHGP